VTDGVMTHRDVAGICNDTQVLDKFNGIAASIKEAADMKGVLVSLQLVPDQVVCMAYPLVNTEDFEHGVMLDSRSAIGLDLVAVPSRTAFSKSVLSSNGTYITGPLTLQQCFGGGACNVSVEKAFIGSLPISTNNHTIVVMNETFKRWGSVEAIINWNALIQRSRIFTKFAEDGKGFRLTRTDIFTDPKTDEETFEVVVLAETDDFNQSQYARVSTVLDTVNDKWQMTIAYEESSSEWLPYAIASTVVLAFFFATLVFLIMLQKQKFAMMQKRYMEDLAQPQKLRLRMFLDVQDNTEPTPEMEAQILSKKPIADFFPQCTVLMADIAGFTSWSSEREPSQVFQLLQTVFFHFDKVLCQSRNLA
jgi:sensor domain CHASE-containing protein